MIRITPAAIAQIQKSMDETQSQNLGLRLAARVGENQTIEYGMGFDEQQAGDARVEFNGVAVIFAEGMRELLTGATLDFVEVNPGEHNFIFINPNDPGHKKPTSADVPD
jgi:iron-sulfur cluster assembly protein